MRIWTVHPRYLDTKGLLTALHLIGIAGKTVNAGGMLLLDCSGLLPVLVAVTLGAEA